MLWPSHSARHSVTSEGPPWPPAHAASPTPRVRAGPWLASNKQNMAEVMGCIWLLCVCDCGVTVPKISPHLAGVPFQCWRWESRWPCWATPCDQELKVVLEAEVGLQMTARKALQRAPSQKKNPQFSSSEEPNAATSPSECGRWSLSSLRWACSSGWQAGDLVRCPQ